MVLGKNDDAILHREYEQPVANADAAVINMDPAERKAMEKRLVKKLDTRLMPVLFVMIILKSGI